MASGCEQIPLYVRHRVENMRSIVFLLLDILNIRCIKDSPALRRVRAGAGMRSSGRRCSGPRCRPRCTASGPGKGVLSLVISHNFQSPFQRKTRQETGTNEETDLFRKRQVGDVVEQRFACLYSFIFSYVSRAAHIASLLSIIAASRVFFLRKIFEQLYW